MKHLYIIIFVILTLIFLLISGRIGMNKAQNNIDYSLETKDLDSRQALEYYFEAWNEKNIPKMAAINPKAATIAWEMNWLRYVKVFSIEKQEERNWKTEDSPHYYEEVIYQVEFEINYWGGSGSGFINGRYVWFYQLSKETEDSPWLIHNYGV